MTKNFLLSFMPIFLTSLSICVNDTYSQSGWAIQVSGTTRNLSDVFFTDAQTGIAVGNNGVILHTTTGGEDWSSQPSGTTMNLWGVFFSDPSIGTVVGDNGTILRTADGGMNWARQTSGTIKNLRSVFFSDAVTGFVVGDGGTILHSTDGGATWAEQTSGTTQVLTAIAFLDANTGIAVGNSGTILRTTDGGTTWTSQVSGTVNLLTSICFTDSETVFAVGYLGTILRSVDGGMTWESQSSGTTLNFFDVFFSDVDTGTAVGASGIILRTWNGGTEWFAQPSEIADNLWAVFFLDDKIGVAVGGGGTILHTTNGGEFNYSPRFQAFFNQIYSMPASERSAIVNSFMASVSSFPFVEEDTNAYFIHRREASKVEVVLLTGDDIHLSMTRLPNTDFWFSHRTFESDARIEYQFIINGSNWILDPRNPSQVITPFGRNSELAMPDYVQPPEIKFYPNIPHGTLHDTTFTSTALRNTRRIRVYTPPSYDSNSAVRYPIALFHDGLDYIDFMHADNVINYLIAEGRIEPIIGIFVPPVNRDGEYSGNLSAQFSTFIVDELMPYIDAKYKTNIDPASRAMIGVSSAAVIATQISYNNPKAFGQVAAISPAFWVNDRAVYNMVVTGSKKGIKFYVDWGTYETSIMTWARPFRDNLILKGYDVEWNEWHEGHTFGHYRAHLDNALEFFFSPGTVGVQEHAKAPAQFRLLQNYPNPFNPSTSIGFTIPRTDFVTLKIYDVLGTEVTTLVSEHLPAGKYDYSWSAAGLASGIYFYRLTAGEFVETRKMTLIR